MNPQMLLQVVTQALMREQQARDQLEGALVEESAKVARLETEVAELKPKPAKRTRQRK